MTGKQLFEKYTKEGGNYGRTLMTIMYNIGPEIEPLLERAEKSGKKLAIAEKSKNQEELTSKDIILS